MHLFKLVLQFTSEWLTSSGQNAGYVDTASVKDENGLPYLPTSAIKGMWREAALDYCDACEEDPRLVDLIFGKEGKKYGKNKSQGKLSFIYEVAQLDVKHQTLLAEKPELKSRLFSKKDKTARDNILGAAKEKTKRAIETVVPVPLVTLFQLKIDDQAQLAQAQDLLESSFLFFNKIAHSKYNGLGKVHCTLAKLDDDERKAVLPELQDLNLSIDYSKGELNYTIRPLNRFAITQHSRTAGANEIFNFIPGSIVMGMLSNHFYSELEQSGVFSKNAIRFGNAYPVYEQADSQTLEHTNHVLYPMPLAFHQEKVQQSKLIVNKIMGLPNATKQYKQCRKGFADYDEAQNKLLVCEPQQFNRRQTATENRVAQDAALFETTTIEPQFKYQGKIYWDANQPELNQKIEKFVTHLSRHLQKMGRKTNEGYGSSHISFSQTAEPATSVNNADSNSLTVWALSDLMLLDEFGQPNLAPLKLSDLGLVGPTLNLYNGVTGKLNLAKSFIRTRSYMPFNGVRGQEPQRYVIEKGSVLVYELETTIPQVSKTSFIGLNQFEGLGQVWLNPPMFAQSQFTVSKLASQINTQDTYVIEQSLLSEGSASAFSNWLDNTGSDTESELLVDELCKLVKTLYQHHRSYKGGYDNELSGPSMSQWQNALRNPDEDSYTKVIKKMLTGPNERDNIWASLNECITDLAKSNKIEPSYLRLRLLKKLSRGGANNWQQGVFN